MKRGKRVRQRGAGASGSERQARNLGDALFDHERLGKQTYLTIPELCAYGRFPSENAAYLFLQRHPHKVPKCRQGRKVLVRRRDFDRAIQPRGGAAHG